MLYVRKHTLYCMHIGTLIRGIADRSTEPVESFETQYRIIASNIYNGREALLINVNTASPTVA